MSSVVAYQRSATSQRFLNKVSFSKESSGSSTHPTHMRGYDAASKEDIDILLLRKVYEGFSVYHARDHLQKAYGIRYPRQSAYNLVHGVLMKVSARFRPMLTPRHLELRRDYLRAITLDVYHNVAFTDEKLFNMSYLHRPRVRWVLNANDPRRFIAAPKATAFQCMVLGGIHPVLGASPLVIFTSTVDTYAYSRALTGVILPWLMGHPGAIFMQDNAAPHSTDVVRGVIRTCRRLTHWPPNSPDFNPIEYVWGAMEQRRHSMRTPRNLAELEAQVQAAWEYCTEGPKIAAHYARVWKVMEASAAANASNRVIVK